MNTSKTNDLLSIAELEQLLKGNAQETIAFESEANQDAFEGYRLYPSAIEGLPSIKAKIERKLLVKALFRNASIIALISMLLVIASYIGLSKLNETSENIATKPLKQSKTVSRIANSSLAAEAISPANKRTQMKEETIEKQNKPQIAAIKSESNQIAPSLAKIAVRPFDLIVSNGKPNRLKLTIATLNIPVFYLQNLKCVDYQKLLPSKNNYDSLTGVEAMYENKFPIRTENYIAPKAKESYEKVISEAMNQLAKNDYKKAIESFKELSIKNPDDANVNFYQGLAYFHQNQLKEAIVCFEKSETNYPTLFAEESLWHRALALKNLGDEAASKVLFERIIAEEGFYSERAKKESYAR